MHLFCSIEHVGVADFPSLGGAVDQTVMQRVLQSDVAGVRE